MLTNITLLILIFHSVANENSVPFILHNWICFPRCSFFRDFKGIFFHSKQIKYSHGRAFAQVQQPQKSCNQNMDTTEHFMLFEHRWSIN